MFYHFIDNTPLEIAIKNEDVKIALELIAMGAKITPLAIDRTLRCIALNSVPMMSLLECLFEINVDFSSGSKIIAESVALLKIFKDRDIKINYYDIIKTIINDDKHCFELMFYIALKDNNAENLIGKCFEHDANKCLKVVFEKYPIEALENYLASLECDFSLQNIEHAIKYRQGYHREITTITELLKGTKTTLMYTALEQGLFNVCHFLIRLGVDIDAINRKSLPEGFSRQKINAIVENAKQLKLQMDDDYGETFRLALERGNKKLAKWAYLTKGGRLDNISVKILRKSGYTEAKIESMLSIKDEIIKSKCDKRKSKDLFDFDKFF